MAKYNNTFNQKLHKKFCEIEGCNVTDSDLIQWHHIVERTEIGTSNDPYNISIICANCHLLVHTGKLRIIGVFPASNKYGRKLIYELDGIPNVPGIDESYFKFEPKQTRIINGEREDE